MTHLSSNIQCNIKYYRLMKGWSQEELAQMVQVRRQAIYEMESGRYLPNTVVALRLARVFGCTVENLFVEAPLDLVQPVHVVGEMPEDNARLTLAYVRKKLVGVPLSSMEFMFFNMRAADGFLQDQGENVHIVCRQDTLDQTIFLMGGDPALDILGDHIERMMPAARAKCLYTSSKTALSYLTQSKTHAALMHSPDTGTGKIDVAMLEEQLGEMPCHIIGFSLLEAGLMVAKNNPLGIRTVADLAQPGVRLCNRGEGSALRVLLDTLLHKKKVLTAEVEGYGSEVYSHHEGAYHVVCKTADAALGVRVVAESFGLHFVPIATTRCDMVIPLDMERHPVIAMLLDVLHSPRFHNELASLPGYDNSCTGQEVVKIIP